MTVTVVGAVRDDVLAGIARGVEHAASLPRDRGPALVLVVGSVGGSPESPEHGLESTAAAEAAIVEVFAAVRRFGDSGAVAGADANLVALIDDDAALGDPSRVLDSTVAGAVISLLRGCALEFARSGANVTALMTPTIARDGTAPAASALDVAPHVAAALADDASSTGREVFIGDGRQLGRLLP